MGVRLCLQKTVLLKFDFLQSVLTGSLYEPPREGVALDQLGLFELFSNINTMKVKNDY